MGLVGSNPTVYTINSNMKLKEILQENRPSPAEEKHCLRKHRYPTMKDARGALLRLWKKKRPEKAFYRCKYCKQFHLTSKKPTGIATT